eukprot:2764981-Amphidinium_carterae.1
MHHHAHISIVVKVFHDIQKATTNTCLGKRASLGRIAKFKSTSAPEHGWDQTRYDGCCAPFREHSGPASIAGASISMARK